ncbi:MAG: UDP-2,3-diacylglucosamine diphosphatase [Rudaea sp.]
MTTLFISDLHLDDARPQLVRAFEELLAGDARAASALYILGDLFESYIGDDDDAILPARVATALRALCDSGVPVFFLHGNRDFLLGAEYAKRAGMTLLPDPTIIELRDQRTLLMHGDTLCIDDVEYQKFRAQVRDPQWQRNFLAKPLAQRRTFAAQARDASRLHTSSAKPEIMDVNQSAAVAAMRTHGVRRLIHGHTHRPATHRLDLDGRAAERIVLGDWYEQSSVFAVA